jgi:hypothetical protein
MASIPQANVLAGAFLPIDEPRMLGFKVYEFCELAETIAVRSAWRFEIKSTSAGAQ